MLEDNGLEEMRKALEIEQKISTATANRKQNLIAKSSSSLSSSASKKRMLTPRGSPTSKSEIEEKLVAAQNRREIYLSNKVDKAKSTRVTPKPKIKINKTLFSSVSPSGSASVVSSDDGSAIVSPRIKAARLEEYQVSVCGLNVSYAHTSALYLYLYPSFHNKIFSIASWDWE